jgi:hypothetical protein
MYAKRACDLLEMMMSDTLHPVLSENDLAAGGVLQDEVNRRRAADGLALRGQLPRDVQQMNHAAFTTHVAHLPPRRASAATRGAARRWRPLVIASCIGALAAVAGTAVWGFFPEEVTASMTGFDQAVVSLGSR